MFQLLDQVPPSFAYPSLSSVLQFSTLCPPLTQRHADTIALSVQQSSNLSQVAVPLAVVLIHRALQQVGVVRVEDTGNPLLCALHKHAGLLWLHEVPHALVRLVAGVLHRRERADKIRRNRHREWETVNKASPLLVWFAFFWTDGVLHQSAPPPFFFFLLAHLFPIWETSEQKLHLTPPPVFYFLSACLPWVI